MRARRSVNSATAVAPVLISMGKQSGVSIDVVILETRRDETRRDETVNETGRVAVAPLVDARATRRESEADAKATRKIRATRCDASRNESLRADASRESKPRAGAVLVRSTPRASVRARGVSRAAPRARNVRDRTRIKRCVASSRRFARRRGRGFEARAMGDSRAHRSRRLGVLGKGRVGRTATIATTDDDATRKRTRTQDFHLFHTFLFFFDSQRSVPRANAAG